MASVSNVFKAILSRMMFAGHSLVTIYWVTVITENPKLWYLAVLLVALVLETIQCVIFRGGQEHKWVSFSILCYLTTTIPCAWIMELHVVEKRSFKDNAGATFFPGKSNASTQTTPSTTRSPPFKINTSDFTDLIEQTTLLVLILGRWLLPKGTLSRESLSELLLVNLAMSADIIEFFDILKLEQAKRSKDLIITILTLWTISLLQFPLTGTAKLDDQNVDVELTKSSIDQPTRPSHLTRQERPQSRVSFDASLRQAPLSDRKLTIVAPQIRRSSVLHVLNSSESTRNDELSVLPNNQMKKLRLKRNSVAVSLNGNIPDSVSSDRAPRRLSVDFNNIRKSHIRDISTEDCLPNRMTRRNSRDIQSCSRASVDITAERFTAQANFERLSSVESTESSNDDDKPKHRVTMDLIGTTMALFLQDGPFLTFRLYVIAQYSALQYMIVFLTVKNALLVVLQIYKISVQHCVCHDHKDNDFSPENIVDASSRLNNVQIAVVHEEGETRKSQGPSFKARRGRYKRLSVRWSRTKASITGSGPLFHKRHIP